MSVFILNFDYWRFHLQNRTPQLVHLLCRLIEPISVRPEFSLFCFSVKLIRIQWTRMNPCALCFITKKPLLVVHCIQYWNHLFLFIYISNYWLICEPLVLSVSYLQCHASYSRLPTVFLHSLLFFALNCALGGWPLRTASPGLCFLRLLLSPGNGKHRQEVVGRGGSSIWEAFLLPALVATALTRLCLYRVVVFYFFSSCSSKPSGEINGFLDSDCF